MRRATTIARATTISGRRARLSNCSTPASATGCSRTSPTRCTACPAEIVERQAALFDRVHPEYGKGVREAVARTHGGGKQTAAE
jgi:catalase